MSTSSLRFSFSSWTLIFLVLFPKMAFSVDETDNNYKKIIEDQRTEAGNEQTQEYIVSGAAAIIIGTYGYYNTSPNPLIKLVYAATQTGGVLAFGQAIRSRNNPRLILEIDDAIQSSPDGRTVNIDELKKRLASFKRKSSASEASTLAYTSSVLSTLYFYNGYRENKENSTLRNVYYFLSLNFAIGGAVGFYRMKTSSGSSESMSISIIPYPTITYNF